MERAKVHHASVGLLCLLGDVAEPWAEPFFGFFDGPAFALCVGFDLVFLEFADGEVVGFRMGEQEAGYCCAGVHGAGFGEGDAGLLRCIEQIEEDGFFGVVRL